ncbi:MAG: hypothetical protein HY510_02585 [Acidobacteria bacterium]|nr:hypothetical protein [Acidobacteriota bacterium]
MAGQRSAAVLAISIGVLILVSTTALPARSEKVVAVRGRVMDESGAAVPGHAVRLLKSRSVVQIGGLRSRDQHVEELRAATDEHGFFEFDFPADSQFPYYYLRFYDPKNYDAVKYRLPEDSDISRRVRRGRPVQVSVVLKFHPDWLQVKALIDRHGAGTHCGQILRSLGLPSSREARGAGREIWTFEKAGVSYLVEGSKVLETHRLRRSAPSGAGPDAAERPDPAARVENQ